MILARMMRFYGMQPSEYDALPFNRHRRLVKWMDDVQEPKRG